MGDLCLVSRGRVLLEDQKAVLFHCNAFVNCRVWHFGNRIYGQPCIGPGGQVKKTGEQRSKIEKQKQKKLLELRTSLLVLRRGNFFNRFFYLQ